MSVWKQLAAMVATGVLAGGMYFGGRAMLENDKHEAVHYPATPKLTIVRNDATEAVHPEIEISAEPTVTPEPIETETRPDALTPSEDAPQRTVSEPAPAVTEQPLPENDEVAERAIAALHKATDERFVDIFYNERENGDVQLEVHLPETDESAAQLVGNYFYEAATDTITEYPVPGWLEHPVSSTEPEPLDAEAQARIEHAIDVVNERTHGKYFGMTVDFYYHEDPNGVVQLEVRQDNDDHTVAHLIGFYKYDPTLDVLKELDIVNAEWHIL